ncbi:carboxypeptidase regulatory-like domain-containing protein [Streptomyces sp. NRRL F-5123]|uniref:carboxypeptidase regulatory-like domain-containing protein n=1 Tax=Streptomyces sp. NRRL F-5123 TaxID=1463856 RepID=UPI0006932591|nr:carboxypeptidase regulatory-like domain-containing protein [Streptomyces sp. NRRL F-5123]
MRGRLRATAVGAAVALTALTLALPARADTASPAAPSAPAATAAAEKPAAHPTHRACAAVRNPAKAACSALVRDDVEQTRAQLAAEPDAAPSGLGPGDLQAAYALPSAASGSGAGRTVALVDAFDDPTAAADLATYRSQYGLAPCTTANGCFRKIDQNGGTDYPAADPGWSGEIALDIQMVSAVCPNCKILLVEADDNSLDNLGAAVNQAVAQGALFVSNSYGGSESPGDTQSDALYYDHPGVAVTASTGDDGYGVSYPASSPYVTAVGGTSLVKDASARGWTESAWAGAGSGCSAYETKPAVQTDTGCARRSVADVSAVADPDTGVAVYNAGAWHVYGGTSASSPIIASVYALAGDPAAGSAPVAFPYGRTTALNDVVSGANGSCGTYLCQAGAGYDGPTGLGTPKGVAAFASGPHATVRGTVTDSGTGAPLTGAVVTAGTQSATTAADGTYELSVDPGSYDLTVSKFGYRTQTFPGVTLADGQVLTEDAALAARPMVKVSGTVKDGSGHGWPLYATVQVEGEASSAVHTDPATGSYALSVPEDGTYALRTTSAYPGYSSPTAEVTVADTGATRNFAVPVDGATCSAAGYAYAYDGTTQDFATGSGTTPPAGWTITDAAGSGQTWSFDDPAGRGNHTGGSGTYALIDSAWYGRGNAQDSSLVSPAYDFSGVSHPYLSFGSSYWAYGTSVADTDLSVDGGATWQTLLSFTIANRIGPSKEGVALPAAAGKSDVRVRFHFTASGGHYWQVDDVFVGDRPCAPTTGGLVLGQVVDKNTGTGVAGASVVSADKPAEGATSVATPGDAALGDGFFWFVSTLTGSHPLKAAAPLYTAGTASVQIAADAATDVNLEMAAGRLSVTPAATAESVAWKGSKSAVVTVKNTGSADASMRLVERDQGFTLQAREQGAALQSVPGNYSPTFADPAAGAQAAAPAVSPAAAPWTSIADLPAARSDNAAVTGDDGKVYSIDGASPSAIVSSVQVYDPDTLTWSAVADSGTPREAPQAAFVDGKLYVTGGWNAASATVGSLQIYDPVSGAWTTGAPNPKPYAGAASAVVDGKWYIIGGCTATCGVNTVQVYDTDTNTWSSAANYPLGISWLGCGAIDGAVYCAGGSTGGASTTKAYSFDPAANTWSALPDMPFDLWGTGATAADGKLLLSGGVTANNSTLTNKGTAYDPSAGTWTDLPNSNNAVYRGGSTCGFYKVGGSTGSFSPVRSAELLPGYGQCGSSADVTWLSADTTSLTLAPGQSADITLTLDASGAEIAQPGTFAAALKVVHNTPYTIVPLTVAMTVEPPSTWGKITGTVTGTACGADEAGIKGAIVQLDGGVQSFTLRTAADGRYGVWIDTRDNPLSMIVAKDGWIPQSAKAKVVKGRTTTKDFTLKPLDPCS